MRWQLPLWSLEQMLRGGLLKSNYLVIKSGLLIAMKILRGAANGTGV
jgi:hypothetical protein